MGKHRDRTDRIRSKTLPSSPSHSFSSSSSSDFEFTIAVSPRKSSAALCPADELFYKGQLLPLHLSPRISMVRTLLLSSSSTSSSATTATASRDSTGSSSSTDSSTSSFASDFALLAAGIDASCDSSRPSSVAEDESASGDLLTRKLNPNHKPSKSASKNYFSLSRFSNVFKKDPKAAVRDPEQSGSQSASVKRTTSSTAKDVIRKYLKKVKPLYEKLSQKQQQQQQRCTTTSSGTCSSNTAPFCSKTTSSVNRSILAPGVDQEITVASKGNTGNFGGNLSQSFSGNLGFPRRTRRSCVASCPSSMRSSPSHSGVLSRTGFTSRTGGGAATASFYSDNSTMEELQSAIQGAIAHCKNSMLQSNKASTSNSVMVGFSNEI